MAFRVETSTQAESDASEILEWLLSHHAGEPGYAGFSRWKTRLRPWLHFPNVAHLLLRPLAFLLKYGNFSTDASPMCIGFYSP
jgi:hypothetical protein